MTLGTFLIFKCLKTIPNRFCRPIEDLSKLSYGVCLMHRFMLGISYPIIGMSLFTPLNKLLVAVTTCVLSCFSSPRGKNKIYRVGRRLSVSYITAVYNHLKIIGRIEGISSSL